MERNKSRTRVMAKIGFGGSCHWCTEAIFLSLNGIVSVEQGWIASNGEHSSFSEAVIVEYNAAIISLGTLIAIHLSTHSCTANHSMRSKYRSAIYTFTDKQAGIVDKAIIELQKEYESPIITKILPYKDFKINRKDLLNYYYSNPEKPFCENIINPKLRRLMQQFSSEIADNRLEHLKTSTCDNNKRIRKKIINNK